MVARALAEKKFIAGVSGHPSFINDGQEITTPFTTPICFILSKDEGPHTAWAEAVAHSEDPRVREISLLKRYDTMHHGFMTGRGDFTNPENKAKVDEAICDIVTFLKKVFQAY